MEDVLMFPVNVHTMKSLERRPQAFSSRGPLVMLDYAIKAGPGPVKAWRLCTIHPEPFTHAQKRPTSETSTAVHRCEASVSAAGTRDRTSVSLCTEIIIKLPHCRGQDRSFMKKDKVLLIIFHQQTIQSLLELPWIFFFPSFSLKRIPSESTSVQPSPQQPSPARVIGWIEPFTSFLFEIITAHLINLPSVFIMVR